MGFAKIDTKILDSSLWVDRGIRDIFLTALLMAMPYEVVDPVEQIEVSSLQHTGFVVPPGWYGFVPAAGPGLCKRALLSTEEGMASLQSLGSPDPESRSQDFEGRRMVRVNGGYLILNYMRYRDRDTTNVERQRRFRERKRAQAAATASGQTPAAQDVPVEIANALCNLPVPDDGYLVRLLKACREKSRDVTVHEIVFWINDILHKVQAPTSEVPPRERAAYVFKSVVNNLGGAAYLKAQEVEQQNAQRFLKGAIPKKLARKMWEELGCAFEAADEDVLAQTISIEAKKAKVEPAEFYGVLLGLAQSAQARGEVVNRFWFKDRKFAEEVGNGRGRSQQRGKTAGNLAALAAVWEKRDREAAGDPGGSSAGGNNAGNFGTVQRTTVLLPNGRHRESN